MAVFSKSSKEIMTNSDEMGMSSSWTDSLARNQRPNNTALLSHLRKVHQKHTGFTEKCASTCRDNAGRNSYEWLADVVPNIDNTRVLDLACGSGLLLKILNDRNAKFQLTGVDMSSDELKLAKERLSESKVELIKSRAQDLKLIGSNSIDVVVCHWALTLMDPISPVLNEIHRILSVDGIFGALVDGPMGAAPGYKDIHDLIYNYVQAEIPSYGEIELGDPRIRGTESLSNLVLSTFPASNVTVETSVVSMEGPVTEVAKTAAEFFYAAFVLPHEARQRMISELSEIILLPPQSQDEYRKGRFAMPINRLLVSSVPK